MDRRKHYDNNKIQENLYQYEMGIDLGAEIEYDKRRHEAEAAAAMAARIITTINSNAKNSIRSSETAAHAMTR